MVCPTFDPAVRIENADRHQVDLKTHIGIYPNEQGLSLTPKAERWGVALATKTSWAPNQVDPSARAELGRDESGTASWLCVACHA
jgi:hypothetical protein